MLLESVVATIFLIVKNCIEFVQDIACLYTVEKYFKLEYQVHNMYNWY